MILAAPPRQPLSPQLLGSTLLRDDPAFIWAPERSGFVLDPVFVALPIGQADHAPVPLVLPVAPPLAPTPEAITDPLPSLEPAPSPVGAPPVAPYGPPLAPPPATPHPLAPPLDLLVQPPAVLLPLTFAPIGPAALDLSLLDALLAAAPVPEGLVAVPVPPPPPHLAWIML